MEVRLKTGVVRDRLNRGSATARAPVEYLVIFFSSVLQDTCALKKLDSSLLSIVLWQ